LAEVVDFVLLSRLVSCCLIIIEAASSITPISLLGCLRVYDVVNQNADRLQVLIAVAVVGLVVTESDRHSITGGTALRLVRPISVLAEDLEVDALIVSTATPNRLRIIGTCTPWHPLQIFILVILLEFLQGDPCSAQTVFLGRTQWNVVIEDLQLWE
jgi:hypothetical protein